MSGSPSRILDLPAIRQRLDFAQVPDWGILALSNDEIRALVEIAEAALDYQDELFLEATTGGGDPEHYLAKLGKALDATV